MRCSLDLSNGVIGWPEMICWRLTETLAIKSSELTNFSSASLNGANSHSLLGSLIAATPHLLHDLEELCSMIPRLCFVCPSWRFHKNREFETKFKFRVILRGTRKCVDGKLSPEQDLAYHSNAGNASIYQTIFFWPCRPLSPRNIFNVPSRRLISYGIWQKTVTTLHKIHLTPNIREIVSGVHILDS